MIFFYRCALFIGVVLMAGVMSASAQKLLVSAAKNSEILGLADRQQDLFKSNYKNALEQAGRRGWEVKRRTRDGGLVMLQGVNDSGFPVYLRTDNNTVSAQTTNTVTVQPGGLLGLNLTGSTPALLNKLAIWDGGWVLTTHQEFAGKTITVKDQGNTTIDHATHVAGTMIAKGAYAPAKGMAYGATSLASYDFNSDIAEITAASGSLLLSNHSYGGLSGWVFNDGQNRWEWYGMPGDSVDYTFGYYDQRAMAYDRIAYDAPYHLIVQSAGNSRNENGPDIGATYWGYRSRTDQTIVNKGARPATISSNNGFDILNSTANSKNVLTVGAIGSLPYGPTSRTDAEITSFSSWGPTDDGRVKPDLVGAGSNVLSSGSANNTAYIMLSGTSMAAPNITGSLYLLQEYYSQKNSGKFMLSATLKGLAIHTAFDVGNVGPDYTYGWGVLDMKRAAQAITDNGTFSLIKENTLGQGQTQTFDVVASGNGVVSATICWTDVQGSVTTGMPVNERTPKLVNDLDITINDGGKGYLPWVLDPSDPSADASRGNNIRDNVEQVYIEGAVPGRTYTITVTHKGTLRNGSQNYSLIATGIGGTSYCTSAASVDADSRIDNITLSNLNYTPQPGCRLYSDVTDRTVFLEQSKSYPFSITLGTCGANISKIAKVYIDLNGDNTFDPVTELVATTPVIASTGSYTGNITIPAYVTADTYSLMRIVCSETTNASSIAPCGSYAKGETQDYRVFFTKTSTDAGIVAINSTTPGGSCAGPTNLTVRLKNYGSATISNIPVTVNITYPNNSVVTLTDTYTFSLAPQAEDDLILTGTFNTQANTTYMVTAATKLPNDPVVANDQLTVNIATGTPSVATGLQAYFCDDTKKYILSGNGEGGIFWYRNANDTMPFTAGSPAYTLQAPTNNVFYAGVNDFSGTVGPANKAAFNGGGYNQFTPSITVTAAAPVVLESARLYVGRSGRVTFSVRNANGLIVSSTTLNVRNTRNPAAAGAQPDDPSDQGAVYTLNLLFPAAGKYTISTTYENGATLYRSNSGVTGYPFSVGGVFTINGNNAVSATSPSDTTYYKNFYYYLFDLRIKAAGCASTSRIAVPVSKPLVTATDTVLSSNFNNGNQWYYEGVAIPGATGQQYVPVRSGMYQLKVTINSGCTLNSEVYRYARPNLNPEGSNISLSVFPVPATTRLNVLFKAEQAGNVTLTLVNTAGQVMQSETMVVSSGDFSYNMDVSKMITGTYMLKIIVSGRVYGRKIIIVK